MTLRSNKVLISVTLTAMFAATDAVAKENVDNQDLFSLSLEELLEVNISSSTLTEKQIRNVPSSITVFTRSQIQNIGSEFLHELINYVPGFQSFRQEESGDEYYHSARARRSSTTSREVLILVDGVRFNRDFDNAISVPALSLHNVEKVEFIRGPGSALYGANAFLGVISISTQKDLNQVRLVVGEHNTQRLQAMASFDIAEWQANVSINLDQEDGANFILENVDQSELVDSTDPRSGQDIQFNLGNHATTLQAKYYNRKAEEFYTLGRTGSPSNQTQNKHRHLNFQHEFNTHSDLRSSVEIVYSKNVYEAYGQTSNLGAVVSIQEEDSYGIKMANDWFYSENNSLQFGVSHHKTDTPETNIDTENFGPLPLYAEQEKKNTGIYVQSQSKLKTNTDILIGGRYDDYNETGSAFSPRLSVVQPLTDTQTIKLLYGEAFRSPTINETKLLPVTGSLTGNPNLNPETISTWEMIWIKQWDSHLVSLNAFYNTIEDIIIRDEALTIPTFVNASSTESFRGLEFEFSGQLSSRWMFNFNTSVITNLPETEFRQADRLASFILNYADAKWNINLSGTYSGERAYLTQGLKEEIDDYWLVNSKLQHKFSDRLQFHILAKNLFDQDFYTPTQRDTFSRPVANRGRELVMGLSLIF